MKQNPKFKDRIDGGRRLAEKMAAAIPSIDLVLGLPRGGVPVAYEVSQKYGAPLDTIAVRKIGAPFNPEFGVGAVASGGVKILESSVMSSLRLGEEELTPTIEQEIKELKRREEIYKSGKYLNGVKAGIVALVDDGLATGVTAVAAIEAAKKIYQPLELIFAAPVCAADTVRRLRGEIKTVCIYEIEDLLAVGNWYVNFDQTTDEEVVLYLKKANQTKNSG